MKTSEAAPSNKNSWHNSNEILQRVLIDYKGDYKEPKWQVEELWMTESLWLQPYRSQKFYESFHINDTERVARSDLYSQHDVSIKERATTVISELPTIVTTEQPISSLARLVALQNLIDYDDDLLAGVLDAKSYISSVLDFNLIYRGDIDSIGHEYRNILAAIAREEGFESWDFNVDPTEYNSDYGFGQEEAHRGNMPDKWPLGAMILLDFLYKNIEKPEVIPDNLRQFVPFAIRINERKERLMGDIVAATYPDVFGRLKQLSELNPEVGQRTEKIVKQLIISADMLSSIFPDQLSESTRRAFLDVTLLSVYGILEHTKQGAETSGAIELGPSIYLPFRYEDDEPLLLLETLNKVVDELFQTLNDEQTQILFAVKNEDYNIIRFIRDGKSRVISYIRPFGGKNYNPNYEYGNSKGVEASMGYTVYGEDNFANFDKRYKGSSAVSIRIDREGINPLLPRNALAEDRDPTREVGNLSLDVGSILGEEDSYGTKLGRFLAWSNVLQSEQVTQFEPTFNHAPQRFPAGSNKDFGAALAVCLQRLETDPRLIRSPRSLKKLIDTIIQ